MVLQIIKSLIKLMGLIAVVYILAPPDLCMVLLLIHFYLCVTGIPDL